MKQGVLDFDNILLAKNRISDYIIESPIIISKRFNKMFNAEIFFKMENQQITNSFKIRGALNAILSYRENCGKLPQKIVVQSSGNHAQAMAYVAKKFNIELVVYMADNVSIYKINKVKELGAKVIICKERSEANELAKNKQKEGYFFIHPSDNDDVILGQATCALEILKEIDNLEAIFVPCGGGGLVSGCYLATQEKSSQTKIYACEPSLANDASISVKQNNIFSFVKSPDTIADGARTLAVSQRCFQYLKKIAAILEVNEKEIEFWRNELQQEFNQQIEPTAALAMAGFANLIKENSIHNTKKYCVIITGGNIVTENI